MDKSSYIKEVITREWLNKVVDTGCFNLKGRTIFVRKMPPVYKKVEIKKIKNDFTSKNKEEFYLFHGTSPENLYGILKFGLFCLPDRPVFSTEFLLAPASTARIKESKTGYGIITVWNIPKSLVEQHTSWDKNWWVPKTIFNGKKNNLPIRDILKEEPELRQAFPEYCVGFLVIDAYINHAQVN